MYLTIKSLSFGFKLLADNLRGKTWLGLTFNGAVWTWDDGSNEEVLSLSSAAICFHPKCTALQAMREMLV